MTFIYSKDGSKKVNIDDATMLGDIAADLKIYKEDDDNQQLWLSKNGSFFKGCTLHGAQGWGGVVEHIQFVPLTKEEAKAWVIEYYGSGALRRFGFVDDAEEI